MLLRMRWLKAYNSSRSWVLPSESIGKRCGYCAKPFGAVAVSLLPGAVPVVEVVDAAAGSLSSRDEKRSLPTRTVGESAAANWGFYSSSCCRRCIIRSYS